MNHLNRFVVLAMCLLWGSGCDGRQAGGPSSVETQNSIAGRVLDSAGIPVVAAQVSLYQAQSVNAQVLQSDSTDSLGQFKFWVADSNLYNVQIVDNIGRRSRSLQQGMRGALPDSHQVVLQQPVRIWLTPDSIQSTEVMVRLYGMPGEWLWSSDTLLSLELPSTGTYMLQWNHGNVVQSRWLQVRASGDTLAVNLSEQNRVQITDFEGECNPNLLAPVLGGGWGYVLQSEGVLTPATVEDQFADACEQDTSRSQSLHLAFTPNATHPTSAWTVLGLILGQASIGVNLTQLDSVVFWARGSGTLGLGIVTLNMIHLPDYRYASFPNFTLQPTWTRYSFAVSALAYPSGSNAEAQGLTWLNSASQSVFLQWAFNTQTNLWLDDVELIGVDLSDLIRFSNP